MVIIHQAFSFNNISVFDYNVLPRVRRMSLEDMKNYRIQVCVCVANIKQNACTNANKAQDAEN